MDWFIETDSVRVECARAHALEKSACAKKKFRVQKIKKSSVYLSTIYDTVRI